MRLAERMENTLKEARLAELQERMAYTAALSVIESCGVEQEGGWLDLWLGLNDERVVDLVKDALEFLELVGRLEFHPENEDWCRFIDPIKALQ